MAFFFNRDFVAMAEFVTQFSPIWIRLKLNFRKRLEKSFSSKALASADKHFWRKYWHDFGLVSWNSALSKSNACSNYFLKIRLVVRVKCRKSLWTREGQKSQCTAWCSEIGFLRSLDALELHASVTSENQFHCTRLYSAFDFFSKTRF